MQDIFIVYDSCCLYEVMLLNYFMSCVGRNVVTCSLDGSSVRSMEGYSINPDMALDEIDETKIASLTIPGGDITKINNDGMHALLRRLKENGVLISAICAGVDVLKDAGISDGIHTIYSDDSDVSNDHRIITARPNGYVDFAIEVMKELDLFEDEADLRETIDFFKYHKRV